MIIGLFPTHGIAINPLFIPLATKLFNYAAEALTMVESALLTLFPKKKRVRVPVQIELQACIFMPLNLKIL